MALPSRCNFTVSMFIGASLLLGCSSKSGGGDDTSTDTGTDAEDVSVEEPPRPDLPEPPVMTPCPDGWREVTDEETGVVVCDPWPEGGMLDCTGDEAHFIGEPGCSQVGTPCPTGTWADGLPGDATIVYVQAGATAGGDGSEGAPFATISEGMLASSPGNIVALSRGTYTECVDLAAVTLWGACVSETIIDCDEHTVFSGTIRVFGAGNTIRNLTITGRRAGVWVEGAGRIAHVQDVIVEGTQFAGLVSTLAGRLTTDRVLVRDIEPIELDNTQGYGAIVDEGGFAQFDDTVFLHTLEVGIVVDEADVIVNDTVVHESLPRPGTSALGRGISIQNDSTIELNRTIVSDFHGIGVGIEQSTGSVSDTVIRDAAATGVTNGQGMGLLIVNSTDVSVDRTNIMGTRSAALQVDTSTAQLADIVIRDTDARFNDLWYGLGILIWGDSTATVTRTVIERSRDHGMLVSGSTVDIMDLVVRDTRERVLDDEWGRGLTIQTGATVTLLRGLIENNLELGVNAWSEGTILTAQYITITDTQPSTCNATTCPGLGGGVGLGAYSGAHIDVTDFVVEYSYLAGAQLAHGSTVDVPGGTIALHDGQIAHNPIGVNIQTTDFDIDALQDNVQYLGNDRNLDTEFLPLPGMGSVSM